MGRPRDPRVILEASGLGSLPPGQPNSSGTSVTNAFPTQQKRGTHGNQHERLDLSVDPEPGSGTFEKLVGYDVEATDGHIGKIDEASTETDRNYLVVDTGFWIFGKKRLVPAGVVVARPRRATPTSR